MAQRPSRKFTKRSRKTGSRLKSKELTFEKLEDRRLLATYYVDDVASNGAGTFGSPFNTIQAAANVAAAGDIVEVRGGTYRETVNVPRSGNSNNPIVFRTYQNEEVILSGADQVTGWTNTGNNVWTANVNWDAGGSRNNNTLFVNGALQHEAQQGAENDFLDINDWGVLEQGRLTSGASSFVVDDLGGFPNDYWNGAQIKFHTFDYAFATKTITDFNSSTGRITLDSPVGAVSQKQDNGYYIFNTLNALDKPGEWFKATGSNTLYYKAAAGQNPNSLDIEFKRRDRAFNVSSRDYINIEGFTFRGASITTNASTDYNVYAGNTLHAFDRGGFGRFFISGDNNVFRDNEVYEGWTTSVTVRGTRNSLVNNYFHDIGFNGDTRLLSMSGSEHLISHNTFQTFARSVFDGYSARSEFSYNLFEDAGRLTWDTGVFDSDGTNGNTSFSIFHHNVFRDTSARGIMETFYGLNNNAVIHHNIIYDFEGGGARGNFAAGGTDFRQVYHNTIISNRPPNGLTSVTDPEAIIQSRYNNNLQISQANVEVLGVSVRGNHDYSSSDFVNFGARDLRLAVGSGAIDIGVVLPGINDGFTGAAPDAGALEFGEAMWDVGHDFVTPHTATYNFVALPGTNLFTNSQFIQGIGDWTIVSGTPNSLDRNSWNLKGQGNSLTGNFRTKSVEFSPGESIRRLFTGLTPNTTYTLGAAARIINQVTIGSQYDGSSGSVSFGNYRAEPFATGLTSGEWIRFDNIDFGDAGQFDQIELMYTRAALANSIAGTTVQIRLGSPTGQLLAELTDPIDDVNQVWYRNRGDLPTVSGSQSIYISVSGANAANLAVGSVRLSKETPPETDKLTILASGAPGINAKVGWSDWQPGYEQFTFTTGPSADRANILFVNNGRINAYLDRMFLIEGEIPSGDNLAATQGDASQSSTFGGLTAFNATDEDDTTRSETLAATSNSWWQMSLPANISIGEIELFNRDDARYNELSNFTVSVWDGDPDAGGNELWHKSYFSSGSVEQGGVLQISGGEVADDGVTHLGAAFGRVVRVQLNGLNNAGNGALSLKDVAVRSSDKAQPSSNRALFGEASQSSNFRAYTDLAENAINGIVSPAGEFTTTENQSQPWWQVDLKNDTALQQIVIVNRESTNLVASRIGTFRVSVWNGDPNSGGSEVWGRNYSYSSSAPAVSTNSIGNGGALRIDGSTTSGGVRLDSVTNGRFVRVQKTGTNLLSLAEVQVWAAPNVVDLNAFEYVYDLGTSAAVFSGAQLVTPSVNGDISFTGTVTATDRGSSTGNAFNRDFIGGTSPATFNHNIANGRYQVKLNMSDPNVSLDNMFVRGEGIILASNIDRPTGVNTTFAVEVDVTDGQLNLEFGDADVANPLWAVNRIVLTRTPSGSPTIDPNGGAVDAGTDITITNLDGAGTVYYTTNGTDPRLPSGTVNSNASATSSSATIVITDATTVTARTLLNGIWSDVAQEDFSLNSPFFLGDANLNGVVDFLDIQPFISLLSTNSYLNEADTNRDGIVSFLDIGPFIDVLSGTGTAQASAFALPVSSSVSLVSVSEPVSTASVASTDEVSITTKISLAKNIDAEPATVSENITATIPLPQVSLESVSDSLASPMAATSRLPAVSNNVAVAGVTSFDNYSPPVAIAPVKYRFLGARKLSAKGPESNGLLAKRRSLTENTERLDISQDSHNKPSAANLSTEKSFSTAAELFDARPESLDGIFDFQLEESYEDLNRLVE